MFKYLKVNISKESITYKYLVMFILVIVMPIFIISIMINSIYVDILLKNSSNRMLQTMEQLSVGIQNEINNLVLAQATIAHANDYEIIDIVTAWHRTTDNNEKLILSREIDSKLRYLFNYKSGVQSVIFFLSDGSYYYSWNGPNIETSIIEKLKWYQQSVNNPGKPIIVASEKPIHFGTEDNFVLSVSSSPDIAKYRNDVEVLYYAVKTNIFDSLYSDLKFNLIGNMMVVDNDGNIMVSKYKELQGKNISTLSYLNKSSDFYNASYTEIINGKKAFITTYSIASLNWKIINIVDYHEITKDTNKILFYSFVFFGVIITLFLFFSILFFRNIINPINQLTTSMRTVEKGNFDIEVDIRGNKEIKQLGHSFNRMVKEIKNLIFERDFKEKERSKAEIQALQSQINPHFVYNTLNTIKLMAMIAKVDNVSKMLDAFIKLLSASFGKGGEYASIEAEIETLENYIFIMKMRYGDQFILSIEVDEALKQYKILKLLLQPIIENSILHGIRNLRNSGRITIKGYPYEDGILFEVNDNGVGISEEQIQKILTMDKLNSKSFNNIGLNNVNKRIKLNHGEKYGITISSKLYEYTSVKLFLPKIEDNTDL